jgi:hypothetical protein
MKYLFIITGIIAAVVFSALTWGPVAKGPTPTPSGAVQQPAPLPPEPPPIPAPAPYAQQQPLQIQMPRPSPGARQGATEPAEPMPHGRLARAARNQATRVNRPVANGFTAELNREELQSLQSGGRPPRASWHELYPPR